MLILFVVEHSTNVINANEQYLVCIQERYLLNRGKRNEKKKKKFVNYFTLTYCISSCLRDNFKMKIYSREKKGSINISVSNELICVCFFL